MNMILHNITRFTIENGDTLEDPQITKLQQEIQELQKLLKPSRWQKAGQLTLWFFAFIGAIAALLAIRSLLVGGS